MTKRGTASIAVLAAGAGLWFAFGGFLLCAAAAAVAPPARAGASETIGV